MNIVPLHITQMCTNFSETFMAQISKKCILVSVNIQRGKYEILRT